MMGATLKAIGYICVFLQLALGVGLLAYSYSSMPYRVTINPFAVAAGSVFLLGARLLYIRLQKEQDSVGATTVEQQPPSIASGANSRSQTRASVLADYNRRSNIAAGIFLILLTIFLVLAAIGARSTGNIWQSYSYLPQAILIAIACAWFYAVWAYARWKGRSGFWALAGILGPAGLIILLILSHKPKDVAAAPRNA